MYTDVCLIIWQINEGNVCLVFITFAFPLPCANVFARTFWPFMFWISVFLYFLYILLRLLETVWVNSSSVSDSLTAAAEAELISNNCSACHEKSLYGTSLHLQTSLFKWLFTINVCECLCVCVGYPAGLESATGWSCMVSSPSLVKAAPAAEKISPTCGTHTSVKTVPGATFTFTQTVCREMHWNICETRNIVPWYVLFNRQWTHSNEHMYNVIHSVRDSLQYMTKSM